MTVAAVAAPRLDVLRGAPGPRPTPVGRDLTIGRDPRCGLVLPRDSVSRRHARVVARADGHYVDDLDSTAGTLLNGRPVLAPARLADGDVLTLGDCLLAFRDEAGQPAVELAGAETIVGRRDASGTAELGPVADRAEEKLAAILGVARHLAGGADLQVVLGRTLDALLGLFPRAERAVVLLADGDRVEPRAVKARAAAAGRPALSRTVYDHVVRRGEAVLCRDAAADDRFRASRSVDEARLRTVMCAPLWDHHRRAVGVLQVDASRPDAGFARADLDLLAAVAGPVGLAVENARLLGRARREHDRLGLLAEAGVVLAGPLDVGATLDALARLLVPRLGDVCVIDVIGEDGAARRVAAAHGDPGRQGLADELRRVAPPDPGGDSPAMRAMRSGEMVVCHEADDATLAAHTRDAAHLGLVRRLGCRSFLCVPLVARGRPLGVLSLLGTGPGRRFGRKGMELAGELARRAAVAVDNARLYAEARAAREAAEAASRAKDRLLAMLSHELRTPLTPALLAVTGLLDDPATPAALRGPLELARRGVEQEARLVDDLLDATRAGAGKLRLDERDGVDIHEVARRALETAGPCLDTAGLRAELDLSAAAHHARGDAARLQQVLVNLLRNAAKFTPAGGRVAVRTRVVDDWACRPGGRCLVVEVADTGEGIDAAALPRIFEAFEQGGADRRGRAGGLGLGLAISRAIAEAHGGRLAAASAGPGRGATFTLELPAASTAPAAAPPPPAADPPAPPVRPLRILLVEDDGPTARVLARLLGRGGSAVAHAADLAGAYAECARGEFDVVVSDLGLPDGSGVELARWLAARGGPPAIALTGYGMEQDVRACGEAGFAAHLTKPVELAALEAAIRRVAGPASA